MRITDYYSGDFRIETERLILRKITAVDAPDMYKYASDPQTSEFLLWTPHPSLTYTRELIGYIQRDYNSGKYFDLAVIWKETGRMIGTSGFTSYDDKNHVAEVGYVISPKYWHMGIATEALSAMMNFAFCELDVNRVECKYIAENENSRKVMEKCGMKFEGVLRGKMLIKGVYRDIGYCSILKSEYFSVPRKSIYKAKPGPTAFTRLFGFHHKN